MAFVTASETTVLNSDISSIVGSSGVIKHVIAILASASFSLIAKNDKCHFIIHVKSLLICQLLLRLVQFYMYGLKPEKLKIFFIVAEGFTMIVCPSIGAKSRILPKN